MADAVTDQQSGGNNNIDMDNIQPPEHDESVEDADQTSFIDLQSQVSNWPLITGEQVNTSN